MKHSIWSMYDKRAGIYADPVMYRNDDVAKVQLRRSITQDLESGNIAHSILNEFEYVKLAEFNDRNGEYIPISELERERVSLDFGVDVDE